MDSNLDVPASFFFFNGANKTETSGSFLTSLPDIVTMAVGALWNNLEKKIKYARKPTKCSIGMY